MDEEEKTRYLSNVYLVIAADGEVDNEESRLFELVTRGIRAGVEEQNQAKQSADKKLQTNVAQRWSDRIRNLEDMMFVAYANQKIDPSERELIVEYARSLDIEQSQLNQIKEEAKARHLFRQKIEEENRRKLTKASSEFPYGIDERPLPLGADIDKLLPVRVGSFERKPTTFPEDVNIDQVYLSYSAVGHSGISVEFGSCRDAASAQRVIHVVQAEGADVTEATLAISLDTDPSYLKVRTDNPRMGKGIGFAWTRGSYFFSISSSSEKSLNAFMAAFPY